MEVKVFNKDGKATSKKVKLNDEIFGIEPNDHVVYLAVKQFLAAQRQGTHKAKERGEITGSTKKIKKQKGTGTARAGSIKNPLFRGGGRVFGPRPRNYEIKLPKKVKRLARKSALSSQVKENNLTVVENFSFDAPKTKDFNQLLTNFESADKKTLLVLSEQNNNIYLSSRNLKGAKTVKASELNTYDVLNAEKILIQEGAIAVIETALS